MTPGKLAAILGLIGWIALAIKWLGNNLVVVIPVVVLLAAAVVFLAVAGDGAPTEEPDVDRSDFMEHGRDTAWPADQEWDMGGHKLTEAAFAAALEEYRRTGRRPDWAES